MVSEEMIAIRDFIRQQSAGDGMSYSGDMDPLKIRETIDATSEAQLIEENVTFTQDIINGIEVEVSTPAEIESEDILVYIHGGGFVCGNTVCSRGYASQLSSEAKMLVYSLNYRLAPEDPFPAGADDCFALYQGLVMKYPARNIFLIGESAGANLLIVTALRAMEEGIKLPAGLVPYSGPFDFTGKIDREKYSKTDFNVGSDVEAAIAKFYFPNHDPNNIYISPLNADLNGLPPMMFVIDKGEVLSDDSRLLAAKAKQAGVYVELYEYDAFHAFPIAGKATPESYEVMKDTIRFITKFS